MKIQHKIISHPYYYQIFLKIVKFIYQKQKYQIFQIQFLNLKSLYTLFNIYQKVKIFSLH